MNRIQWNTKRRAQRDRVESREERGLPQHPASDYMVNCTACETGEHYVGQVGNDPQTGWMETCRECDGHGEVPDGRGPDPLVVLGERRHEYALVKQWPAVAAKAKSGYRIARIPCFKPVPKLALIEARAFRQIEERRMIQNHQHVMDAFAALGVAA